MKKVSLSTIVITVVAIMVSGMIGGYRKEGLGDFRKSARVGQKIELDAKQWVRPRSITMGQYAVAPKLGKKQMISPDRFVSIEIDTGTPVRKELSGLGCRVESPGGHVSYPVADDIRLPPAGFRTTGTVIFEMAKEHLAGAELICRPGSVIYYREPLLVVDLGVSKKDLDRAWDESAYRKVKWQEYSLEVHR